jgi:hypothetical protein
VTGIHELGAKPPAGFGVADPLVPGVGVAPSVAFPVGVGVGEDVAVDVDVPGDGDCDVLSWLGDMLAADGCE